MISARKLEEMATLAYDTTASSDALRGALARVVREYDNLLRMSSVRERCRAFYEKFLENETDSSKHYKALKQEKDHHSTVERTLSTRIQELELELAGANRDIDSLRREVELLKHDEDMLGNLEHYAQLEAENQRLVTELSDSAVDLGLLRRAVTEAVQTLVAPAVEAAHCTLASSNATPEDRQRATEIVALGTRCENALDFSPQM